MINAKNKQIDETDSNLFAPAASKRQIQLKKHNRSFIFPQQAQNNELRWNRSCPQMQKELSPPYSQFKNKLMSYLQQSQKHEQKQRENLQQQQINISSAGLNNKKQTNNLCKHQTSHNSKKSQLVRKNIKRYISQVTQAKRKRNTTKNSCNTKTGQTETKYCNQSASLPRNGRREISIVVSKQNTHMLQQLVPIHHTRTYFYQKQPIRRSYNAIFQSPMSQEFAIQYKPIRYSQYSSIEIPQSKPSSSLQIQLDQEDQSQQFDGKFQEHGKLLNIKGHVSKFHSKKKPFLGRNRKKESDQQPNQISPWRRRRNTVDSQLPPTD